MTLSRRGYVDEPLPESLVRPNGGSVAAILAAGVALLMLGLVVIATEVSETWKTRVFDLGKAAIPHAEHIGPYSGKEVVALASWVVAWVVLHFALRHRDVNVRTAFGVFLAMLLLATILIWPPVWHLATGK